MANYEMTSVNNNQFLNEAWSIEQNIDRISNNITSIRDIQTRIVVAVATAQESALAQERDQL
ncbi:18523_t:CDS:1, partial [Acaulospora morrowiae]